MKKIESIHELIEVARRMPVGQLPDTYFLTHIRPQLKVQRQTAVPKEGYGFSNYVHSGLVRPKVSKFQFRLQAPMEVDVKMQYW